MMTRILAFLFVLLLPAQGLAEPAARPAAAPAARPAAEPAAEIELITLEAQPTIERTVRAKPEAFAAAVASAVMSLMVSAGAGSLEIAGPPFARYKVRSKTVVEADLGLPVRKAGTRALPEGIRASKLPAGRAAALVFRGRHEHLPRGHAALDAWLLANKKKPGGARWEVYLTNPFETPDPDAQQTRIFAPIQ
jgi:effector-binding domain-containing protein